jgi:pyridoxal phosphate enzyme (YggS family)
MSPNWEQSVEDRLRVVRQQIAESAERSQRSAEEIKIVAITKGQPVEAIRAALGLGLNLIGENRVEEALEKQSLLVDADIDWHMVGHIQSRKAVDIPGHFVYVHSIDRMKIAQRINRFAHDQDIILPVLLECNVSGEATKSGWACYNPKDWSGVVNDFQEILKFPALRVRGLMTMAPWVQDHSILRATFQNLRNLREYMTEVLEYRLPELSMGMSDDYQIAIEEGATMVRLGRALFGPRS